MNCINCNTDIPKGKLFCPTCGTVNKEQVREAVVEAKREQGNSSKIISDPYHETKSFNFSSISLRWKLFVSYFFVSLILYTFERINYSRIESIYLIGFFNNIPFGKIITNYVWIRFNVWDYFNFNYIYFIYQLIFIFIAIKLVKNYYSREKIRERNLILFIIITKISQVITYSFILLGGGRNIEYLNEIYSRNSDAYEPLIYNYTFSFLIHSIPLIYFYGDETALKFVSWLTGKEFKLSNQLDSRNYNEEFLVLKDTFLKTSKGRIVFVILLSIYFYPIGKILTKFI